jgi:hypothetical protein
MLNDDDDVDNNEEEVAKDDDDDDDDLIWLIIELIKRKKSPYKCMIVAHLKQLTKQKHNIHEKQT